MKNMSELTCKDIHSLFIIIDKSTNKNLIAEYCGKNTDKYSFSSLQETHRFEMSYNENLNIYATMYPFKSQANYIVQRINLPFDIISIINQYIHEN